MNFDLSSLPTTFDMLHLILAALSLILSALFLTRSKNGPETTKAQNLQSPVSEPTPDSVSTSAPEPKPDELKPEPEPTPAKLKTASPDAALQLLTLLQQDARFIDFINEDLSSFSDSDIGAAARVVHEGSKKTLNTYFTLEALRSEDEETRITLAKGFNASEVRLTGNVVGEAPFTGTLIHKGWKVSEIKLPKIAAGHDVSILAPAEVEL